MGILEGAVSGREERRMRQCERRVGGRERRDEQILVSLNSFNRGRG